ncbi:MAG: AsmA-like C-terminal region-containing protein [Paludisphaera borealis]|uniref:AsmA-like C-terminal region-containing protein n=1 Tax=Paludisphaera borealis TaxID=1387353 RepID=UPI0028516E08|nr:AsmA-like C-terminal region-containing protein [Paludisphaera borealis]MDR3618683.1 AsmA-like C-terminal region-containing protein [Paludisphaera borealis]
MKCRRFRRLMLIPVGIALLPALVWSLIVVVAPTDWARVHLVSVLERASGRSVGLESLSICLGGGVDLVNLKIGAPGGLADPWMEAGKVHLDLSLPSLLFGKLDATDLEIENARLRVLRRADGSLELADLVRSSSPAPQSTASEPCGPSSLKFRLQGAEVQVVDEPTHSHVTLERVNGEGLWEDGKNINGTLNGYVNEGPFQLTGSLDRTPGRPSFEGQFRADSVQLDDGMSILRYLVPVLAGTSTKVGGVLTMEMYLRGEGDTCERLRETLLGHGQITIDPIELEGTELLAEVERNIAIPRRSRVASLNSDFAVKNGRVTSKRLALNMAKTPLVITGWTDFDGRLDYRMSLEGLADRVPDRARRLLADLDVDLDGLSTLRLSGTVDDLTVSLTTPKPGPSSAVNHLLDRQDKQRLKMIGQELRDKLFR